MAQITSIPSIAEMANCNRILKGNGIVHPVGDASLPPAEEKKLRRKILLKALKAVQTDLERPCLFN